MWYLLVLCMLVMAVNSVGAEGEPAVLAYKNNTAHFLLDIPSPVVEKSHDESRIVWQYGDEGSVAYTIRVNYIFLGHTVNYDEYIEILKDSKKADGVEIRPMEIREGKGFLVADCKRKRSEDALENIYLVAVSEKGWLCTVAVVGKCGTLKKEAKQINDIMNSFRFEK